MVRMATRILPLAPLVAWVLTVFIPIWAATDEGPGITVSSLGSDVFSVDYIELLARNPHVIEDEVLRAVPGVTFALGLLLAAYPWLRRPGVLWCILSIAAAAAILIYLLAVTSDPPSLMWDSMDENGRPIGGMQVARPWVGMIFWLLGAAALCGAGVAGFLGRRSTRT